MIESETIFKMDSAKTADKVIAAIKPEMAFDSKKDRSEVKVTKDGEKIRVKIKAKDAAAFRSAINTYSKLIQVSKELIEDDRK